MNDTCPQCGAPKESPTSKFCVKCGADFRKVSHPNHCLNPKCPRYISNYNFAPTALNCDECGGFTTIGKEVDKHC